MTAIGDRGPEFTLDDTHGESRQLTDALARGPVVLSFLKADCGACNLAFPYLEKLRQSYPGDDWTLWGISQNPARAAEWFARNTGVTFPILIDGEGLPASNAYDPPSTPTIYLLDRDRIVRATHTGFAKTELNKLAADLAALLDRPPVEIAPNDDGQPSFRPG